MAQPLVADVQAQMILLHVIIFWLSEASHFWPQHYRARPFIFYFLFFFFLFFFFSLGFISLCSLCWSLFPQAFTPGSADPSGSPPSFIVTGHLCLNWQSLKLVSAAVSGAKYMP